MILAGEWIDARLGVVFGMSTMAAAGLGNIISDVAGVGLAHQVEWLVGKLGIRAPALTSEQWDSPKVRSQGLVDGVEVAGFRLELEPRGFSTEDPGAPIPWFPGRRIRRLDLCGPGCTYSLWRSFQLASHGHRLREIPNPELDNRDSHCIG